MGVRYDLERYVFLFLSSFSSFLFLGVLHTDRKATVCSDRAGSSGFVLVIILFLVLPLTYPAWSIDSWVEPLSLRGPWSEEVQVAIYGFSEERGKGRGSVLCSWYGTIIQMMIGWRCYNTVWYCHHTLWTETGGYQCQFPAIVLFLFFFSSFWHQTSISFYIYTYTSINSSRNDQGSWKKQNRIRTGGPCKKEKKKNRMWALSSQPPWVSSHQMWVNARDRGQLFSDHEEPNIYWQWTSHYCSVLRVLPISAREMRYQLVAVHHGQRTLAPPNTSD